MTAIIASETVKKVFLYKSLLSEGFVAVTEGKIKAKIMPKTTMVSSVSAKVNPLLLFL